MTSFAPTTLPNPPMGACDGGGIVARPKPPKYACDGDGLTAKVDIPKMAKTLVADKFDGSNTEEKKSSNTKTVIGATVLLVGGALLGYGHKDVISKGINNFKGTVDKFFSSGKPAEYLQKGKEMIAKLKDMIFVKQPKV